MNSGRLPFAFVGAIAAVIMIVSEVTKKPKKICEDANVLAQIYIVLTIAIFNPGGGEDQEAKHFK